MLLGWGKLRPLNGEQGTPQFLGECMFEIFKDRDKYRFRLLGAKNKVIAVSEAYAEKSAVVAAINATREYAATSRIKDRSVLAEVPAMAEAAAS
jgi:uncharacterized protein YegP (UPF0339 family)